jgi:hypothetical protein
VPLDGPAGNNLLWLVQELDTHDVLGT